MAQSQTASCFDLREAVKCITEHKFDRVVCQFPDEFLGCCTEVYLDLAGKVPPTCDVFIAADSTFGSSVDDISAAHVDADLLIYFGSDLSGSGSVNVMIVPPMKHIDVKHCSEALSAALEASGSTKSSEEVDAPPPTLLVFDPCYLHQKESVVAALLPLFPHLELGVLPPCLGLPGHWEPARIIASAAEVVRVKGSPAEQVAGVYFSTQDVSRAHSVVFIGEKEEQLASLFLRLSQQRVLRYSPLAASEQGMEKAGGGAEVFQGDATRVFRERYGGVSKVKAAKIIGLLVGSMGIETGNLQLIVHQLQALVEAAGKKHYVFVLGRINEAKLCNFPEIDLFCLIANDDNALVPPKTFHVPVITPFELELGLGARVWGSSYLTSCTSSYLPAGTDVAADCVTEGASDGAGMLEPFSVRLQRVEEARANRSQGSDSDSDSEDGVDEAYEQYVRTFQGGEGVSQALALLQVQEGGSGSTGAGGGKLIAFESPAAQYLASREFQGLSATTAEGTSTSMAQGQFGIAAEYARMDSSPPP